MIVAASLAASGLPTPCVAPHEQQLSLRELTASSLVLGTAASAGLGALAGGSKDSFDRATVAGPAMTTVMYRLVVRPRSRLALMIFDNA